MKTIINFVLMLVMVCGMFGVLGCEMKRGDSVFETPRVKQIKHFLENEKTLVSAHLFHHFDFEGVRYTCFESTYRVSFGIYKDSMGKNIWITGYDDGAFSVSYKNMSVSDSAVIKNAETLFDKLLAQVISIQEEQLACEQRACDNALIKAGLLKIEEEKAQPALVAEPNQNVLEDSKKKVLETSKKKSSDYDFDLLFLLPLFSDD